jgi:phosphate transport system substrate-binding protein|tara:strand:- start:79085 stop:80161 length:1077 start_codon:yes stop_codon:yes gene_type:complete
MRAFLPALTATTALLTLAACDNGSPSAPAGGGDASVAGPALRIVGSSTVYPFTTAVAENFKNSNPGAATPIVESTGTGGGLQLFCAGVGAEYPDVANASRRIKASEVEMCQGNGVNQIIEIQVGMDGIAFAESRDGDDMQLTAENIYRALAATAPDGSPNQITNWNQVDSSLPDRRIEVLGPPPTSGTRDAFNELVMTSGCKEVPEVAALEEQDEDLFKERCTRLREDGAFVESGENDNLIVQKLVSNPIAVGIFGYSYLEENLDQIKPVPLNGVDPTYENIANGSYIAARPLYIYAKGEHLAAKPSLQAFLEEYVGDQAIGPDGYLKGRGLIASPDDVRAADRDAVANGTPMDASTL